MPRVALIGFGSIAESGHLSAWQSFAGVELTAIADISAERRMRARDLVPHAQVYDSPLSLIESAEVDILDICTPPNTHAHLIVAACNRGIANIVSEKPFVLSSDEFTRVVQARERNQTRIVCVNNWLYSDLYRLLAQLRDEDAIGRFQEIVLRTGRPDNARGSTGWLPQWRTDPGFSGGGVLLDHGWHQLYLLLGWLGGSVIDVSATTRTVNPAHAPVEDEATVTLRFPQALGRIELSWAAAGRSNDGYVRGERGEIAFLDDGIVLRNDLGERTLPFNSRLTQSSYHSDWFEAMFRYTIFNGSHEEADRNFHEAGELVSIIESAYRSAQHSGAPQTLRTPTGTAVGS